MQERRAAIEEEEHYAILRQIEAQYEQENEKVISQKKLLADQNRQINIIQRKIEQCPSNVEITQFHKRLVELFDNFNFKSEENRKYFQLYNVTQDIKQHFTTQSNYMKEINKTYKESKSKKEKEVLLHNLKNIVTVLQPKASKSDEKLANARNEYRQVQTQFDECMMHEKEHF